MERRKTALKISRVAENEKKEKGTTRWTNPQSFTPLDTFSPFDYLAKYKPQGRGAQGETWSNQDIRLSHIDRDGLVTLVCSPFFGPEPIAHTASFSRVQVASEKLVKNLCVSCAS